MPRASNPDDSLWLRRYDAVYKAHGICVFCLTIRPYVSSRYKILSSVCRDLMGAGVCCSFVPGATVDTRSRLLDLSYLAFLVV